MRYFVISEFLKIFVSAEVHENHFYHNSTQALRRICLGGEWQPRKLRLSREDAVLLFKYLNRISCLEVVDIRQE